MRDQGVIGIKNKEMPVVAEFEDWRRRTIGVELEVDPDHAGHRSLDRSAEGDHGDAQVERKVGRRRHQLTGLAGVAVPAALAGIIAAWRDFDLPDPVAGFVQEGPRGRQLLAVSPASHCHAERRIGRTAHAVALLAFQFFEPLHLQPVAVVVPDIETIHRRPLNKVAPEQAGGGTVFVWFR
jgi:hypothetical protein